MDSHLLEVRNLKKTYPIYGNMGKLFAPKSRMCAVDDPFILMKGKHMVLLANPAAVNLRPDVLLLD